MIDNRELYNGIQYILTNIKEALVSKGWTKESLYTEYLKQSNANMYYIGNIDNILTSEQETQLKDLSAQLREYNIRAFTFIVNELSEQCDDGFATQLANYISTKQSMSILDSVYIVVSKEQKKIGIFIGEILTREIGLDYVLSYWQKANDSINKGLIFEAVNGYLNDIYPSYVWPVWLIVLVSLLGVGVLIGAAIAMICCCPSEFWQLLMAALCCCCFACFLAGKQEEGLKKK